MRTEIFFLVPFLAATCSPLVWANSDAIEVSLPGKEVKLSLTELKAKLKTVTITINDPVYKKKKSYDGFRLGEVLKLAGFDEQSPGDEIVFTAKDGYSPNTSFEMARSHPSVLTFREHGKKDFEFEKIMQGKSIISPAPFYLVWEEGRALAESAPWPYQLVKIEVVNFRQKYEKLFPKEATPGSDVVRGFVIFKNECLRCHSINLQGGELGPELNAPKNVTEYWSRDNLKQFIRNSTSFRYKSKMPPFPQLKDEEIEQILQYLEHMKNFKTQ